MRVLGHHAALAERYSGLVEQRGHARAELGEPAVFRPVRVAFGENDRVVLIGGEKAFAATAGAEDEDSERAGRRAEPVACHRSLGYGRSAPRHRAKLFADDTGDLARVDLLVDERLGDRGQHRPGGRQLSRCLCLLDRVVEIDGGAGPQLEQVSRRDDARELPFLGADGEMADLEPRHAADGAVDERAFANGNQRPRGDVAGFVIEGGGPVAGDAAHHVALRDDAVVADRRVGAHMIRHEDRADAPFRHDRDGVAQRVGGRHDDRRRGHDVGDPVTVGIGIDCAQ